MIRKLPREHQEYLSHPDRFTAMSSPDYAHHFSIRNIPFGVASADSHPKPEPVTRLGNSVVFLNACNNAGLFMFIRELPEDIFDSSTLNAFAALPKSVHQEVRKAIQDLYQLGNLTTERFPPGTVEDVSKVRMHMPVQVGDFAGKPPPGLF